MHVCGQTLVLVDNDLTVSEVNVRVNSVVVDGVKTDAAQ